MESRIISLESTVEIPYQYSKIVFIMTKKSLRDMGSETLAAGIIRELSLNKKLLISARNDTIKVFIPAGTMHCVVQEGCLLVKYFAPSNMNDINIALARGMVFTVNNIIVKGYLGVNISNYEIYSNGHQQIYTAGKVSDINSMSEIQYIVDYYHKIEKKYGNVDSVEEVFIPDEGLTNILDTAEKYSLLSYELETTKIINDGKTYYTDISSVEYERVDRHAYSFSVIDIDEKIFKLKSQVEVTDKDGNILAAEIISYVRESDESPISALVLLFQKQVNVDCIPSSGFISLSSSTVNRDVQCEAINRIRNNKSPASYMNNVLGKNSPGGFATKDLSDVEKRLQAKKYPPNKSQMDAIKKGINSKDVFLVMGPPGTGKTTVILEWIKYFVGVEKKRVLVSSQNNKAVDNVLARIAEEKDIDIIRIGSENKMQSEIVPYMFENKIAELRKNISETADKNISLLEIIESKWAKYNKRFDGAYEANREYIKKRDEFRKNAVNELEPYYKDVISSMSKLAKLKENLSLIYNKIQKSDKKVERYKNGNKLFKFFFYFPNIIRIKKTKNNFRIYNKMLSDYKNEIEVYELEKDMYRQEYRDFCKKQYIPLYNLAKENENYITDVMDMPYEIQNNMWNLFSVVYDTEINTADDYEIIKNNLAKEFQRTQMLRTALSEWDKTMSDNQNYSLNNIVLENVNLVGATCIGINSQKRFANLKFDVTIIDEAGQIQIHNALVPMSVSEKLIMLGDHKQIPPQADCDLVDLCDNNEISTELLEKSLFEKMYESLPESNKTMLDTQYRMPGEIADVISDWFYGGKYYSHESKRNLKGPVPTLSEFPFLIVDTSDNPERFETKIEGAGCYNHCEAEIIDIIINHLIDNAKYNTKEIGVISAYQSQVFLIKKKISKKIGTDNAKEMVATLDSFQGQERDIIVYSFTKSSKTPPRFKRIGFLNELRRLNVAMSRCKKMLVLVGDMKFLSGCLNQTSSSGEEVYEKSEKQFSDFIKKVLLAVEEGHGEMLGCDELMQRLAGEE